MVGYRDAHTFLKEEFEQAGELYICNRRWQCREQKEMSWMQSVRMRNGSRCDLCLRANSDAPCDQSSMQKTNGIECYISLEERMACGIGACLACVCKSKEKDAHSNVHNKRICKDGPVFLMLRRWRSNGYACKYCRSRTGRIR